MTAGNPGAIIFIIVTDFNNLVVICTEDGVAISAQMSKVELLIVASVVLPDDEIVFIFFALRDVEGHFVGEGRNESVLLAEFRFPFEFVVEGHFEQTV